VNKQRILDILNQLDRGQRQELFELTNFEDLPFFDLGYVPDLHTFDEEDQNNAVLHQKYCTIINHETDELNLPFPAFIVSFISTDHAVEQNTKFSQFFVVSKLSDGDVITVQFSQTKRGSGYWMLDAISMREYDFINLIQSNMPDAAKIGMVLGDLNKRKKKWRLDGQNPFLLLEFDHDNVRKLHMSNIACTMKFLAMVNNPSSHLVKVYPDRVGQKTTKWIRSRTHYCIIKHNYDEENNFSGRDVFANNQARDQINMALSGLRTAHKRRAHPRRLNHPRYTYKRGQTIQVKETWIGANELKGTDKKIYKIVDFRELHASEQGEEKAS